MKSTISEAIPLSIPKLGGNEWKYVKECLDTNWVSSVGSYVTAFEKVVAEYTGSPYAVATVNGTAALHISLILSDVSQDDYIILPNITFIASANSILYTGAHPIFIDVDPNTWQMDLDLLENFLEKETERSAQGLHYKEDHKLIKALMPVHVLGNMMDMDRLLALSEKYGMPVIEDSTEALGSSYKGKPAGSFGTFGTLSFNGNKIITTGGGGMILCQEESLAKQAKHLTTQAKADPIAYIHDEIGYNYRLVNILAAMGVAQMEQLDDFIRIKTKNANIYQEELGDLNEIQFQDISPEVQANNWLITIKTPHQSKLMEKLRAHKVQTRPLWLPMNQNQKLKTYPYIQKEDISSQVHAQCLSLPSSSSLKEEQVQYICQLIRSCF